MGRKIEENTTSFLPFFGTDIGQCSLIKPKVFTKKYFKKIVITVFQILFSPNKSIRDLPWDQKMFAGFNISKGAKVGKSNGLTILLDAETYDYMYQVGMLRLMTTCIR